MQQPRSVVFPQEYDGPRHEAERAREFHTSPSRGSPGMSPGVALPIATAVLPLAIIVRLPLMPHRASDTMAKGIGPVMRTWMTRYAWNCLSTVTQVMENTTPGETITTGTHVLHQVFVITAISTGNRVQILLDCFQADPDPLGQVPAARALQFLSPDGPPPVVRRRLVAIAADMHPPKAQFCNHTWYNERYSDGSR